MSTVLILEDDPGTAEEIALALRDAGFETECVDRAAHALALIRGQSIDAMVVDRQLPDGDGLDMIASVRADGIATPALVLSALGGLDERVRGLRSGGDDYMTKPFAGIELIARIEALLRRPVEQRETRISAGPVRIDLLAGTAMRGERPLDLLARELQMLTYLVRREGLVVTRSMLLQDVWGYTFEPQSNVVEVHMSRLRRKVDAEDETQLIRTIRGRGYRFDARG